MTSTETETALDRPPNRGHEDGTVAVTLLTGRPKAQDAALATAAGAFAMAALAFEFGERSSSASAAGYAAAAVAVGALLGRRQHAVAVLAVVVAARLFITWETGNEVPLVPAAVIALFTAARAGERRSALAAAGSAAVVMTVAVAALDNDSFVHELLREGGIMLLPIAIAEAARSRTDRLRDRIDTEANLRVQAERVRIARDLHDVVAHGLSTIAIQAGVAAHLLDDNPGQAKEALEIINDTGKKSLEELRAMVGVLRSTDTAPLRPTPSDPDDLAELIEGATNAGLLVSTDINGAFPVSVGESCVVAVHRIIQEALTNVARHAGAVQTHIEIRHTEDQVEVRVTNQPGRRSVNTMASTGVGIVGMTERAESLGGTLTAGPMVDGGFDVRATIPYQNRPLGTS